VTKSRISAVAVAEITSREELSRIGGAPPPDRCRHLVLFLCGESARRSHPSSRHGGSRREDRPAALRGRAQRAKASRLAADRLVFPASADDGAPSYWLGARTVCTSARAGVRGSLPRRRRMVRRTSARSSLLRGNSRSRPARPPIESLKSGWAQGARVTPELSRESILTNPQDNLGAGSLGYCACLNDG
jgi:hypothetical protein